MASLQSAIYARLLVLIDDASIIDLTRKRQPIEATANTTRLDSYAELAAAEVHASLGSDDEGVDSTDTEAIRIGTSLALQYIKGGLGLVITAAGEQIVQSAKRDLDKERRRRVFGNADPVGTSHDFTDLDARFPAADAWEE